MKIPTARRPINKVWTVRDEYVTLLLVALAGGALRLTVVLGRPRASTHSNGAAQESPVREVALDEDGKGQVHLIQRCCEAT